jgi:prepilin-type N-terminal cleavage/methylation domain-containing protein
MRDYWNGDEKAGGAYVRQSALGCRRDCRKLNNRRGGFTLVEIMVVVAIIAMLAAIAVPNFLRARKRSQATRVLEDLRMIDSAIDQYAIETNKTTGAAVSWNDVKAYLKTGSALLQQRRWCNIGMEFLC